jgi:hypothetical protein
MTLFFLLLFSLMDLNWRNFKNYHFEVILNPIILIIRFFCLSLLKLQIITDLYYR